MDLPGLHDVRMVCEDFNNLGQVDKPVDYPTLDHKTPDEAQPWPGSALIHYDWDLNVFHLDICCLEIVIFTVSKWNLTAVLVLEVVLVWFDGLIVLFYCVQFLTFKYEQTWTLKPQAFYWGHFYSQFFNLMELETGPGILMKPTSPDSKTKRFPPIQTLWPLWNDNAEFILWLHRGIKHKTNRVFQLCRQR